MDKDIEIVKEIITHKDDYDVCFGYRIAKPYSVGAEEIQAISNVLSELERYKQYYEEQNEVNKKFVSKDKFDEVNAELETYKKIAEKLADYIVITDINEDIICADIPEEICEQRAIGDCKQCIIDWARKEVEK